MCIGKEGETSELLVPYLFLHFQLGFNTAAVERLSVILYIPGFHFQKNIILSRFQFLIQLKLRHCASRLDVAALIKLFPSIRQLHCIDEIAGVALPGYSVLTVSNSDGVVHAPLINPEGNTCYFVYTVKLADTGEELYKSGYIEPGSAVPEFELNQELEAGEYDILLEVEAWDIGDYTQALNGGSIEAQLTVED